MNAPQIDFDKVIGLLGREHVDALDNKLADAFTATVGADGITAYERLFMTGRMITMGAYYLAASFDEATGRDLAGKAVDAGFHQGRRDARGRGLGR